MADMDPAPVAIAIAAVVAGNPMLATAAGAAINDNAELVPPVAGVIANAAYAMLIAPIAIAHVIAPLATIFTVPFVISPVTSILFEPQVIAFARSL